MILQKLNRMLFIGRFTAAIVLGLFLCGTGWAIVPVPKGLKVGRVTKGVSRAPTGAALRSQLWDRVKTTHADAWKYVSFYRTLDLRTFVPTAELTAQGVEKVETFNPRELYPNASFLSSRELVPYMLAKNNLEIRKHIRLHQAREEAFVEKFGKLPADFGEVDAAPFVGAEAQWLAEQVPADTQYLLLGEIHMQGLQPYLADFIKHIRVRNPQREIILLTEFLPARSTWTEESGQTINFDDEKDRWTAYMVMSNDLVFTAAQEERMKLVGLERNEVCSYDEINGKNLVEGVPQSFWETVEGMRLRNERWLEVIEEYRQAHPDALFIIYAGSGHCEYYQPYSLGAALAGERTFVATVQPLVPARGFSKTTLRYLPNAQHAQFFGFNASITVKPVREMGISFK
ncbi:MAG: hypothetical protein J5601_04965 [Elusimicrobiaceae bacterium]|nr:hypothetical protein [Elusimicrobiaceae bacterium]